MTNAVLRQIIELFDERMCILAYRYRLAWLTVTTTSATDVHYTPIPLYSQHQSAKGILGTSKEVSADYILVSFSPNQKRCISY